MKAEYQEILQFIDACRTRGVESIRVTHGSTDFSFTLGALPATAEPSLQDFDRPGTLTLEAELDRELFGK